MFKYAAEIKALEEANFGASFTSLANFLVEVIEKEDKLLAYLIYQAVLDEAEIVSIYVKPEVRQQGLATKLLKQLQVKYNTIFLEVNENNQKARRLYQKLGFVTYLERPNYYHGKETAILMKWSR